MAAAADQTFQTSITINGKLDPALLREIMKFNSEMGKTVTQEKKVEAASKKAFGEMKKGLMEVAAKGKEFAISLKEMMLPLLGLDLAFKGFKTIGDTLQAAIDKFKTAKEAAASYRATLEAVVGFKRAPAVEKFDVEQAQTLQAQFKNIYGLGVFKAAQEALHRGGIALGDEAMAGVIQATAYANRTLKLTSDQTREFAQRIAFAFALPRGKMEKETMEMLRTMGVEDLKKFGKMSGMERLRALIEGFKKINYLSERISDKKEEDEVALLQSETERGKLMTKMGEFWEAMQVRGDLIASHLQNAFLEAFVPASDAINKLLKGPMDELDQQIVRMKNEFARIFNPGKEDLGKGYSATNLWGNVTKAWTEDVIPELKRDWEAFVTWAGKIFTNVGSSFAGLASSNRFISPGIYGPDTGLTQIHGFIQGIIDSAVNLGKIATEIGKVSWETMQSAVTGLSAGVRDLARTVADLANAIPFLPHTYVPGSPEEAAKLQKQADDFTNRLENKPNLPGLASGGIINAPQVGLIGEAGPESVVPHKRNTNTLDILASTFSALGIDPANPTAYGHELFDATRMGGFGLGGGSGFTGNVGGIFYTEYGPRIDPPGSPDWDINSYNRRGAWSWLNPLREGDVALGYGAQARYGVQPGDVFTDTRGQTVRFADRSGSKNPMNEDVFHLAAGGIVSKKILSWLGESGPEAVVPLSGSKGRDALSGIGSSGHTFHFSPTISVSGVATSEVVQELSETLQRNFSRWIEDAAFEHERRAFS